MLQISFDKEGDIMGCGPSSETAVFLEARMEIVRSDLDEVLGKLDQEMMNLAPKPGMRTISGLLVEIAQTELQTVAYMTQGGPVMSDEEAQKQFGDCDSLENMTRILKDIRVRTLSYLGTLSEAQLQEPLVSHAKWFSSLGLSSVPRAEVFRSIAQHEWYHVGQLISYLWAMGDDPYSW